MMEFFENELDMELTLSGTTGSVLRPPDVAFVGFTDIDEGFYSPPAYVDNDFGSVVKSTKDEDDLWSSLFGGGNLSEPQQPSGSPPLWLETVDPSALEAILDEVAEMAPTVEAPPAEEVILEQIRDECERFTPESDTGMSMDSSLEGSSPQVFTYLDRASPTTQYTTMQPMVLVCTQVSLPSDTTLPPGTLAYKLVRDPKAHLVDHPQARTKVTKRKPKADRRERKKDQNRQAAYRYRLKKKQDRDEQEKEVMGLQARNDGLKRMAEEKAREIVMLKGLLAEFLQQKKGQ